MNKQMTALTKKPKLKGIHLLKALLERQKFISERISNGSNISELEKMGFKFGQVDLSNITTGRS